MRVRTRAALVATVLILGFPTTTVGQDGEPPPTSIWNDRRIRTDPGSETRDPGVSISATELVAYGSEAAGRTGARPRECIVREWDGERLSAVRPVSEQLGTVDAMVNGEDYYLECTWTDTGVTDYAEVFTYQPGVSGPRLDAIARRVADQVPLVFPRPATSPAIDGEQITGLPTWLWIDPGGYRSFDAEATLAGLTVTVTATPLRVSWNLGDGSDPVVCDGPGTPYDLAVDDDAQHTDCSHVYRYVSAGEPGGLYHASATTTWSLAWEASTGETGTLPDVSRTTTFDLDVTERQAVVTYDA
jgi:hypothetical protein